MLVEICLDYTRKNEAFDTLWLERRRDIFTMMLRFKTASASFTQTEKHSNVASTHVTASRIHEQMIPQG